MFDGNDTLASGPLDIETVGNNVYRTESRAFCLSCNKPVELVSFDGAAEVLRTSYAEVRSLSEMGDLHRVNNKKGIVMICSESLFAEFNSRPTQRLDPDIFKTMSNGELA